MTTRLHGLSLSRVSTGRFTQLRYVDAAELDEDVRASFDRPCVGQPELAAVFVDPEEFSYRTFENIIGLDRMFGDLGPAPIRLQRTKRLGHGISRWIARVSEPLRARLEQLEQLELFVAPFDTGARGGARFIFHAAELATALTAVLREVLPARSLTGFVHVNPVFRCNRFEPGDARFIAHVDSPYHDRSRHHVSKYTLLLYLTGGRGDAVLRFGDRVVIDEIEPMTAFVFEQRLEHEGGPYIDGRKLFLRTELIFEDPHVEYAPGIAEVFAKACYLGSQSVFTPELARPAHAAYDRAAAAHWRGPPGPTAAEPFVHKRFRGAHFVTNGYDFWFRKHELSLIESAAIAVLDLLNATIGGAPFRQLCTTEVLVRSSEDRTWIAEFLGSFDPGPEPVFARLNKPALFPEPEPPIEDMEFPTSPDFADDPFPSDWEATRHAGVIEAFARARRYAMKRIFAAPITMLGHEVFLDPERFVVEPDRIHVLSSESIDRVHFAGAVFFGHEDFVGVDVMIDALQPLVPPIGYRETADTVHLTCDLFRNSWMVSQRTQRVPIPRVLDDRDVGPDTAAWFVAASASCDRAELRAELDEG